MSELALKRIAANKKTKATSLNLAHCDLTALPSTLGDCVWLKDLRLSENKRLSDLSPLSGLSNLQLLDCSSTQVSDLSALSGLSNLQELSCAMTQVIDLSPLSGLYNMEHFWCSATEVSDLSPLSGLYNLKVILCDFTQVSDLSPLSGLYNLQALMCDSTQVSDLSPLLPLIRKNIAILVNNCPLINPPVEIAKQGTEAILKWFGSSEKRPILEAKVMFIGDSGYGKTHLIEMLKNGSIKRDITTTLGIERSRLEDAASPQGPVRLNVWDLGGQEFMRSTHQFFFTTRTLYVLVTDARQGERREDLRHWLNLVKELGENAPVLIVINKIDENDHDIDRERLDREYDNIVGYVRTCVINKNKKGIQPIDTIRDLKMAIDQAVTNEQRMPGVFMLQRPEWFTVKDALESDERPYITIEDYRRLEQISALPVDEQDFGLRQMAFIGTVVSYHTDPRLADTHVIDPKWIMDGIYALLNDPTIKEEQKGRFNFADMRRILSKQDYPDSKLPFLTDLMRKFRLCYPLRGSRDTFLLPDLFSDAEPEGVWLEVQTLRFRFNYDTYPPDAFMAQFIAAKYESIDDEKRWRSGVVISDGQCRAVVRRSFKYEHIEIEVAGPERQRRGYLHAIREVFYELHHPFGTLNVLEELPWKDEWLDFRDLLKAEADGDSTYRIKGGERANLSELLDGYAVEQDREIILRALRKFEMRVDKQMDRLETLSREQLKFLKKIGASQTDFLALKDQIEQLNSILKAALETEIKAIPEPHTEQEKESAGKRLLAWAQENAEGIFLNVTASAYWDLVKYLVVEMVKG
ncbi:MAG: COR domain-containing protein [Saprospiraceae bacterium]